MEAASGLPGPGLLQRSHTVGPGELKRSTSNNSFQRSPSYHQHQVRTATATGLARWEVKGSRTSAGKRVITLRRFCKTIFFLPFPGPWYVRAPSKQVRI